MKRVGPGHALTTLVLVTSPLFVGCGSNPTCADVNSLQHKLDGMNTDDPDYNTTVEKLNRAQADCNSSSGY